MDAAKRKSLEAKGFRIGTAAEFVGATPAEAAIAYTKIALADKLKATRLSRKLTQAQVAKLLKMQQSNIARLELGAERTVSIEILIHALLDMGVSSEDITATMNEAMRASADEFKH